jgi:hypothetical protein
VCASSEIHLPCITTPPTPPPPHPQIETHIHTHAFKHTQSHTHTHTHTHTVAHAHTSYTHMHSRSYITETKQRTAPRLCLSMTLLYSIFSIHQINEQRHACVFLCHCCTVSFLYIKSTSSATLVAFYVIVVRYLFYTSNQRAAPRDDLMYRKD